MFHSSKPNINCILRGHFGFIGVQQCLLSLHIRHLIPLALLSQDEDGFHVCDELLGMFHGNVFFFYFYARSLVTHRKWCASFGPPQWRFFLESWFMGLENYCSVALEWQVSVNQAPK